MGWIDTIVITLIIIIGLMIMYKALKEPIDHLGRLIGMAFGAIRDRFSDAGESGVEVIRYG